MTFSDLGDDLQAFLRRPLDPLVAEEKILAFEAELATVFGAKEAVAVSSGTAALHCALAALDIGPAS